MISSEQELRRYLKEHTNMTEHDINKSLKNGYDCYINNEEGFELFLIDWIASLEDPEEAPIIWNDLEIIGDYRFDWYL